MAGINEIVIGKCSQCGGEVTKPLIFWSVNRPIPQCKSCGAVMDTTANLPVIPTHQPRNNKKWDTN